MHLLYRYGQSTGYSCINKALYSQRVYSHKEDWKRDSVENHSLVAQGPAFVPGIKIISIYRENKDYLPH